MTDAGVGGPESRDGDSVPIRIDRASRGAVAGPVAWAMVANRRIWAWDRDAGLVRLTGVEDAQPFLQFDCLSPDGRYLYRTHEIWDDAPNVYEIATGQWLPNPPWDGDHLLVGSYPPAPSAQRLDVYRYKRRGNPPEYLSGLYLVHRGDDVIELPLDGPFGFSRDGVPMQFSPSGRHVAITHLRQGRTGHVLDTSVVTIATGEVSAFEGVGVATCGTWNPSETRVLLSAIKDHQPNVVELATGATRPLKDLITEDEDWLYAGTQVGGWIDDKRVLMAGEFGRRIIIATLDVDTGERFDLLDIPRPTGEYHGIRLAPAVVQADPTLVGPR